MSYLGFDFSTQQLKAIVINEDLEIIIETYVNFDSDLPEFRTHNGVHVYEDKYTITAPTLMWVKGLDIILEKLKISGLDFATVRSISGAAQQHGLVFWKNKAMKTLGNVTPDKFLHEQLQECFSVKDSPTWMDSSSGHQCETIEDLVGGPLELAKISGSRAFERFSASQLKKLWETKPSALEMTERIGLISSFAASLFIGRYAEIEFADASGMNLLDIQKKDWSEICLNAVCPSIKEKLGKPVPSCTILGSISKYFISRYGFSENCKIIAFTGDNPSTVAGTQMTKEDVIISLGTSDTLILWSAKPVVHLDCHNFVNPICNEEFMTLLCFKNGSNTRERIKDQYAEGSWTIFNDLLKTTPRGNFGNIGIYHDYLEILPHTMGDYRFNRNNLKVQTFSKEVEARALVEGQFLSKRVYAEELGFSKDSSRRIIATGGASVNESLLKVLADVFNLPVYVLKTPNSACLGAAYRAKHALLDGAVSFHEMFTSPLALKLVATPAKDAAEVYGPMLQRYRKLEEFIINPCCTCKRCN